MEQIDTVPDGAVLYISSPDVPNAVYGGLMSTCAQARGAVGTVVNGRVRDLAEHRDLGFPVRPSCSHMPYSQRVLQSRLHKHHTAAHAADDTSAK